MNFFDPRDSRTARFRDSEDDGQSPQARPRTPRSGNAIKEPTRAEKIRAILVFYTRGELQTMFERLQARGSRTKSVEIALVPWIGTDPGGGVNSRKVSLSRKDLERILNGQWMAGSVRG